MEGACFHGLSSTRPSFTSPETTTRSGEAKRSQMPGQETQSFQEVLEFAVPEVGAIGDQSAAQPLISTVQRGP